nr:MAG TPA: hypothetical protein [Caudoviricetes sp.]
MTSISDSNSELKINAIIDKNIKNSSKNSAFISIIYSLLLKKSAIKQNSFL